MNIAAASAVGHHGHAFGRIDKIAPTNDEAAETQSVDESAVQAGDPSNEKTSGVVRLLQEGHFKGVAELRHRIRLHDQLSAEANDAAASNLNDDAADLTAGVREGVSSLAESQSNADAGEAADGEGADEVHAGDAPETTAATLLDEFDAAIDQAVATDGAVDLDAVETDLRAAYDTLIASLQELYAPPVEEPADDGGEIVIEPDVDDSVATTDETGESGETTADPLDEAIASITATFEQALADLLAGAEESLALPDPQPAPGNGVAFDKFLAIYNDLRGATEPIVDTAA